MNQDFPVKHVNYPMQGYKIRKEAYHLYKHMHNAIVVKTLSIWKIDQP